MFLGSDGKLLHTDGPAAEKLRGPKPTVLVLDVIKSLRSVDHRCQRADIGITAVISDMRYGGASSCRHLKMSRQILKSTR